MSQHWLEPDWEPKLSVPQLPLKHFQERGIKALLLDVDKTLLPGKEVKLPKAVINWVNEATKILVVHLLSNNPNKSRVKEVAHQLGVSFTYKAAKPRRGSLQKLLNDLDLHPKLIAVIGDRLFTDVIAGNRLGMYTVLIQPLDVNGNPTINNHLQTVERQLARLLGAKNI